MYLLWLSSLCVHLYVSVFCFSFCPLLFSTFNIIVPSSIYCNYVLCNIYHCHYSWLLVLLLLLLLPIGWWKVVTFLMFLLLMTISLIANLLRNSSRIPLAKVRTPISHSTIFCFILFYFFKLTSFTLHVSLLYICSFTITHMLLMFDVFFWSIFWWFSFDWMGFLLDTLQLQLLKMGWRHWSYWACQVVDRTLWRMEYVFSFCACILPKCYKQNTNFLMFRNHFSLANKLTICGFCRDAKSI